MYGANYAKVFTVHRLCRAFALPSINRRLPTGVLARVGRWLGKYLTLVFSIWCALIQWSTETNITPMGIVLQRIQTFSYGIGRIAQTCFVCLCLENQQRKGKEYRKLDNNRGVHDEFWSNCNTANRSCFQSGRSRATTGIFGSDLLKLEGNHWAVFYTHLRAEKHV